MPHEAGEFKLDQRALEPTYSGNSQYSLVYDVIRDILSLEGSTLQEIVGCGNRSRQCGDCSLIEYKPNKAKRSDKSFEAEEYFAKYLLLNNKDEPGSAKQRVFNVQIVDSFGTVNSNESIDASERTFRASQEGKSVDTAKEVDEHLARNVKEHQLSDGLTHQLLAEYENILSNPKIIFFGGMKPNDKDFALLRIVRTLPSPILESYPHLSQWVTLTHNVVVQKRLDRMREGGKSDSKDKEQLSDESSKQDSDKDVNTPNNDMEWEAYKKETIQAWKINERIYVNQRKKKGHDEFALINALTRMKKLEKRIAQINDVHPPVKPKKKGFHWKRRLRRNSTTDRKYHTLDVRPKTRSNSLGDIEELLQKERDTKDEATEEEEVTDTSSTEEIADALDLHLFELTAGAEEAVNVVSPCRETEEKSMQPTHDTLQQNSTCNKSDEARDKTVSHHGILDQHGEPIAGSFNTKKNENLHGPSESSLREDVTKASMTNHAAEEVKEAKSRPNLSQKSVSSEKKCGVDNKEDKIAQATKKYFLPSSHSYLSEKCHSDSSHESRRKGCSRSSQSSLTDFSSRSSSSSERLDGTKKGRLGFNTGKTNAVTSQSKDGQKINKYASLTKLIEDPSQSISREDTRVAAKVNRRVLKVKNDLQLDKSGQDSNTKAASPPSPTSIQSPNVESAYHASSLLKTDSVPSQRKEDSRVNDAMQDTETYIQKVNSCSKSISSQGSQNTKLLQNRKYKEKSYGKDQETSSLGSNQSRSVKSDAESNSGHSSLGSTFPSIKYALGRSSLSVTEFLAPSQGLSTVLAKTEQPESLKVEGPNLKIESAEKAPQETKSHENATEEGNNGALIDDELISTRDSIEASLSANSSLSRKNKDSSTITTTVTESFTGAHVVDVSYSKKQENPKSTFGKALSKAKHHQKQKSLEEGTIPQKDSPKVVTSDDLNCKANGASEKRIPSFDSRSVSSAKSMPQTSILKGKSFVRSRTSPDTMTSSESAIERNNVVGTTTTKGLEDTKHEAGEENSTNANEDDRNSCGANVIMHASSVSFARSLKASSIDNRTAISLGKEGSSQPNPPLSSSPNNNASTRSKKSLPAERKRSRSVVSSSSSSLHSPNPVSEGLKVGKSEQSSSICLQDEKIGENRVSQEAGSDTRQAQVIQEEGIKPVPVVSQGESKQQESSNAADKSSVARTETATMVVKSNVYGSSTEKKVGWRRFKIKSLSRKNNKKRTTFFKRRKAKK